METLIFSLRLNAMNNHKKYCILLFEDKFLLRFKSLVKLISYYIFKKKYNNVLLQINDPLNQTQ